MTVTNRPDLEHRLLLLAPTGKDAVLTRAILADAGIDCCVCADLRSLVWELQIDVGALLVAEEALLDEGFKLLLTAVRSTVSPPLPMLVTRCA